MNENIIIASIAQSVLNIMENESDTSKEVPFDMRLPEFPLLDEDEEDFEFYWKHFVLQKPNTSVEVDSSEVSSLETNSDNFEYDILNELGTKEFEKYMHMSKITYVKIFQLMHVALKSTEFASNLQLPQIYAISLWKLTTNMHLNEIALKFRHPLALCQDAVQKFCSVIAERFMPWPNSYDTQQNTLHSFPANMLERFPGLFGIVAIKYLNVSLAKETEVAIVLQIICNGSKKIIDCCVELAKEYSFMNTPIGQMLGISKKTLPQNTYLAGGIYCPLKKYLVRPFAGVKIHVNEHLFNLALEQPLSLGKEVLNDLAQRFPMLYALSAQNLTEIRSIVETMCSLHNLCLQTKDDYLQRSQNLFCTNLLSVGQLPTNENSDADEEGKEIRLHLLEHVLSMQQ